MASDLDGNSHDDLVWHASPGTDWVWSYASGRMFASQWQTNTSLR